ncbi:MAG: Crp/Fnr family transcriptional regulator [Waterburya sp.]
MNLSLESKAKEHLFKVYRKEDEIHFLDDLGVWQVNRGVVQLSRIQQDGNEVIVGWLTANSTFENSFNHSSVIYRAIALSDVYIRYYSPQDIAKSPILRRQLIDQLCDRLVKSQQLLTIIAIRCFEERLRRLLLMLKHEIGTPLVDDTRLPIRFTHSHLADVIGTSRITITKILGNFQSQGLIYFDNERHIVIKGL